MAGVRLTKDRIDDILGQALADVNASLNEANRLRDDFLQPRTDQELIDLGYSVAEISTLRGAFGDMDQLVKIYRGNQALVDAKDFRSFAKKLWGLGR